MKAKLFQNKISVRPSQIHGYGVFADKNIRKGEVIEECYMIDAEGSAALLHYYFKAEGGGVFLAGYGMIYNHADLPNAVFKCNKAHAYMRFEANRFIRKGEEILIQYNDNYFKEANKEKKTFPPARIGVVNPLTLSLTRMALVSGLLYGGFQLLMNYSQSWMKLVMMMSLKI